MIWRRVVALASAALLVASSSLFAQPKEQIRKLSNDEKKELTSISAMLTGLAAGQSLPNDMSLTWAGNDLLKAQGNKQYVPFSVTVDPSKLTAGKVSLYWRVVSKDAPAPDPKKDDKNRPPTYAYENLHTLTIPSGQAAPMRISRSFVVGSGSYDVYVVTKEPDPKKKGDIAKTASIKQSITVPDLWNGELNTSSIILASAIDPLPAPLTLAQQEERPYALGNVEIQPAASSKLSKKTDLSVFLLIYNAKVNESNAPDVTVEYSFYAIQNGAEKFFNKTNPQALNAQTLPPGFDPAAGMTNGQTVPLASFPEGDYRLEIKITDKLTTKSLTREMKFSVAGS